MTEALLEQFTFLANRVDWRSAIDITLIALGLLLLYRTIRVSGTYRILVGIAIGLLLFYVAVFLELRAILWLFSNFANVGLIFLIVLFQPELRRIFSRAASWRIGRWRAWFARWLAGWRSGQLADSLNGGDAALAGTFAAAIFGVQRKGRGALIVFPGREAVEPWTSGGYAADSLPGAALIDSIFDPGSAGHDGAVIVENGRIARFGVRLPVSESGRLSSRYGTRHHAAMGLSEQTDALVILVSEERRQVVSFLRGERSVLADASALEAAIANFMRNDGRSTVRSIFRWRVLVEIAGSLIAGLIIWAAILLGEGKLEEVTIKVPVIFRGTPAGLTVGADAPTSAEVTLSGGRSKMENLHEDRISVVLNLSRLGPGESSLAITGDTVRLPDEVHLVRVQPNQVSIQLLPVDITQAVIKPKFSGTPPPGWVLEEATVLPAEVDAYRTRPGAPSGKNGPFVFAGPLDWAVLLAGIPKDRRDVHRETIESKNVPILASDLFRPLQGKEWPQVTVRLRLRFDPEADVSEQTGPESQEPVPADPAHPEGNEQPVPPVPGGTRNPSPGQPDSAHPQPEDGTR